MELAYAFRRARGLRSQEEAARLGGISQQMWSKLERNIGSTDRLADIASRFGKSVKEFLEPEITASSLSDDEVVELAEMLGVNISTDDADKRRTRLALAMMSSYQGFPTLRQEDAESQPLLVRESPGEIYAAIQNEGYAGTLTSEELREAVAMYTAAKRGNVTLKMLDVRASMGTGVDLPDHVEVVRMVQVNLAELRRILPAFTSPQNLEIITGLGDSMKGTYNDGDPIVVDRGINEVTVDGVYVLERGPELFIKRLQRQLDGSLMMISDNEKYKPQHISEENRQQFKVLGRALGVWNFTKL